MNESVMRFCDYILEQMRIYPDVDFRFLNAGASKSFHRNLQFYTGMIVLQFGSITDEMSILIQKEIRLWKKISDEYGNDDGGVHAFMKADRYLRLKKAILVYRIIDNINATKGDVKAFEKIKDTLKFQGSFDDSILKSIQTSDGWHEYDYSDLVVVEEFDNNESEVDEDEGNDEDENIDDNDSDNIEPKASDEKDEDDDEGNDDEKDVEADKVGKKNDNKSGNKKSGNKNKNSTKKTNK